MKRVELQAHKGVELEYPENTMVSFRAAVEQGYDRIELDLRVTKDGQFVVLHNKTINKTARLADGSNLAEETFAADLTFEELQQYDFGIWRGECFRGERIPLFSQALELAKEHQIPLKIDNKIMEMTPEQLSRLFEMIAASGAPVCISCWSYECAQQVLETIPQAEISFDGLTDPEQLKKLNALAGRDRFTVWLPIDRDMAKWAPEAWFATPERVETIRPYAKLGIWAIRDMESFRNACRMYAPDAAETTGTIKPADAPEC